MLKTVSLESLFDREAYQWNIVKSFLVIETACSLSQMMREFSRVILLYWNNHLMHHFVCQQLWLVQLMTHRNWKPFIYFCCCLAVRGRWSGHFFYQPSWNVQGVKFFVLEWAPLKWLLILFLSIEDGNVVIWEICFFWTKRFIATPPKNALYHCQYVICWTVNSGTLFCKGLFEKLIGGGVETLNLNLTGNSHHVNFLMGKHPQWFHYQKRLFFLSSGFISYRQVVVAAQSSRELEFGSSFTALS